MKHIRRVKMKN